MSSNSSLNYEGWGMAASLITMTDCPSVGISQTVIVVSVGYKGKEEGHFSLAFPFLSLHENSQRLGSDWLEGEKNVSWFGKAEMVKSQRQVMLHWWCVVVAYSVAGRISINEKKRRSCVLCHKRHFECYIRCHFKMLHCLESFLNVFAPDKNHILRSKGGETTADL